MIELEETTCAVCGSGDFSVEATGRDYLYKTSPQPFTYVRCSACRHLYLNPRPRITEIDKIYPASYSSFSGKFSQRRSLIAALKDKVLLSRFKRAVSTDDSAAPLRVLDVGCGDAMFLMSLRRNNPNYVLHGLDWHFSPATLEALERNRVLPLVGTAEDMVVEQEYYDVVIMNQLVEHLWQPRMTMERCLGALKPGGVIALETPDPDGYDRRLLFRSGLWGSYYWPRHLNLFSGKLLARMLRDVGFVDIRKIPLLAPLCWTYSIISAAESTGFHPALVRKVVRDDKIWSLVPFAAIDWLMMRLGFGTSNQKIIARKPPR